METADFVLASASPRRRELLQQIGARFDCRPVDLDESVRPGESPLDYVSRLAVEKAVAALAREQNLPVMGADTTVVLDDHFLGKPADEEHAVAMLRSLSGKEHRVMSAVALVSAAREELRVSVTHVEFDDISEERARRYWRTGEPADKAGGYAIQGLGAVFVRNIRGSYSGVVGLPLAETRELLDSFDIPYWYPLTT